MSYLTDGHSTTIQFDALNSGVALLIKPKTVTPPGISAGGANDTTTMLNTVWRTKQPKHLKELTDSQCSFQYDPAVYDQIDDIIGVNGQVIVTFPDDSTLTFWGWLDSFIPPAHEEGVMPLATGTIVCSNQDNEGNEVAPVYAEAA